MLDAQPHRTPDNSWRPLFVAVAISIAVHLAFYGAWPLRVGDEASPESVLLVPPLKLQLRKQQSPQRSAEPTKALEEIVVRSRRRPVVKRPAAQHRKQKPVLKIDRASIRDIAAAIVRETKTVDGTTHNNATVMNGELLSFLDSAVRQDGYVPGEDAIESSFDAGAWADFVQMAGHCFRIQRADPFDTIAGDMWFMTKCPH